MAEVQRPGRGLVAASITAWLLTTSLVSLILGSIGVFAEEVMEAAKVVASDPGRDDQFAISVAVDAHTAVFGANLDFVDGKRNAGSAYVFGYDGSAWVQQAKLIPADGNQYDQFGIAVAVAGDTAVIGAYLSDGAGGSSGSAYVFRYDGSDWHEEAKLTASDAMAGDLFGFSVAVSGDTILAGAIGDENDSGSVYVFRYDGSEWLEQTKLIASDAAPDDEFGSSVALDGNTAVIGAPLGDAPVSDSGSAYVFRRYGSVWLEVGKLQAQDFATGDHFGSSVAISGTTAVVGAHLHNGPGLDPGAAYVFGFEGTGWTQQARLTASDASAHRRFGIAVAVEDDTVLIGSDDTSGVFGSAYVFRRGGAGEGWLEVGQLAASDNAPGDHFGGSLALAADRAVVGAFEDAYDAGSAYMYALPESMSAAPEPGQLPMLLVGTALLAFLDRRRRALARA